MKRQLEEGCEQQGSKNVSPLHQRGEAAVAQVGWGRTAAVSSNDHITRAGQSSPKPASSANSYGSVSENSHNADNQQQYRIEDLYQAMSQMEHMEGDIMLQGGENRVRSREAHDSGTARPLNDPNDMGEPSPPEISRLIHHHMSGFQRLYHTAQDDAAQNDDGASSLSPRSNLTNGSFSGATQQIRFKTRTKRSGSEHQIIQLDGGYEFDLVNGTNGEQQRRLHATTREAWEKDNAENQMESSPRGERHTSPRAHSHQVNIHTSSSPKTKSQSPRRRTSVSNSPRRRTSSSPNTRSPRRLRSTPTTASPIDRSSSPRILNRSSSTSNGASSPRPHHKDLVHASNSRHIIHYSPKDTTEDRLLKSHLSSQMRQSERLRSSNIEHRKEPSVHSSPARRRSHHLSASERHLNTLLLKKQEYEEKRERKKRELQQKEKEKFTGKPKINKRSKKMVIGRTGEVFSRLYEQRQEIVAKRERRKIEDKQLQEEEYNFRPSINPNSAELSRINQVDERVDSMLHWEEERKKKIENLRKAKEEQDQMDFRPRINPLSDKLAKVKKNRNSMRVEDRLLQYREQKLYEKEEKKWEMEREAMERANPKINLTSPGRPHHKTTSRMIELEDTQLDDGLSDDEQLSIDQEDTDVFGRLYERAVEMQHKRHSRQIDRERAALRDARTGQPMYTPMINARSAAMIRHLPVEDILQMKGETSKQKIERLIVEEKRRLKSQVSEKKVSAYSELLTILKEQRDGEDAAQRLMRPTQNVSQFTIQQLEAQQRRMTHRPKINERSRRIDLQKNSDDTSGGASPRYENLLKKKDEYEAKRQRLHEQLLSEQLQECTFKPRQLSQPHNSSRVSSHIPSPYTTKKQQQQKQVPVSQQIESQFSDTVTSEQMAEEIMMYYQ
eukprot:CAMPEP_0117438296 /NCGR_PEP_ID=MMETSP0759-20121206/1980_1 /TAXON_ID=63605 /ORGANISM="Percolomonas cosmopolitus, Strain WS" /LENGTH=895 /DNA_ID=CAMNT_0005229983 /DNA_START=399 /DNA_END=3086 /DNA_ORIENTATION=-